jgi:hypothetical protein
MQQPRPPDDGGHDHGPGVDHDHGQGGGRGVMFLVAVVVVVVVGVWLVNKLLAMREMQDCLASGRTNCAPIHLQGR